MNIGFNVIRDSKRKLSKLLPPSWHLIGIITPKKIKIKKNDIRKLEDRFIRHLQKYDLRYKKICVITDYYLRPAITSRKVLPPLLRALAKVGCSRRNITILMATGAHKKATKKMLLKRFGNGILSQYHVVSHDCKNTTQLRYVGTTSYGNKIFLNKNAVESDFRIGVGSVRPSAIGYSGGSKLILPGIAGYETIVRNHALRTISNCFAGRYTNDLRKEMDECYKFFKLHLLINAVLTQSNEIAAIVIGAPIKAHKKGIKICDKIWKVSLSAIPDVILCQDFHKNLQSNLKSIIHVASICKPGTKLLLYFPFSTNSKLHFGRKVETKIGLPFLLTHFFDNRNVELILVAPRRPNISSLKFFIKLEDAINYIFSKKKRAKVLVLLGSSAIVPFINQFRR